MMCSNKTYDEVKQRVENAGIEVDTIIDNVAELIKETDDHHRRFKRQASDMNWDNYQRYPKN